MAPARGDNSPRAAPGRPWAARPQADAIDSRKGTQHGRSLDHPSSMWCASGRAPSRSGRMDPCQRPEPGPTQHRRSSWATMSAGSTSAPITGASCPARRRTSTSSPAQGMLFTDYYAEASCTAGRANFITGEIPLRTGLTTVGQAGADVGMPDKACTLATRAQGAGLRHRPVRQEPSRRPEQVSCRRCTASTSSSATCTTSTRCPIRTGTRSPIDQAY